MLTSQITSMLTCKTEKTLIKALFYFKNHIETMKCYVKLKLKRGQIWQFRARQREIGYLFLNNF